MTTATTPAAGVIQNIGTTTTKGTWTTGDATLGCKYMLFNDSNNWATIKSTATASTTPTATTIALYDGYFFAAYCDFFTV